MKDAAEVYVDLETAAHAAGVSLSTVKRRRAAGLLRTRPGGLVNLADVWDQNHPAAWQSRDSFGRFAGRVIPPK